MLPASERQQDFDFIDPDPFPVFPSEDKVKSKEINESNKHEVQSMIFSCQNWKEKYHMHRDVVLICPFNKLRNQNRFGMMGIFIYGINSHGRNQVYGIGFINEQYNELENYEFIFKYFKFYMEQDPKVILMSRNLAAGFKSENLYRALLKSYGKQCGINYSPIVGDTQLLFCPYDLQEELKDKF